MRTLSPVTSVLALALGLSLTGTAKANCCNDFWSCAAAVATAGASCAVQAAVDEINNLVRRIERTRDQGERDMKAKLAQMDRGAQQASAAPYVELARIQTTLRQAATAAASAAEAAPKSRARTPEAEAALARGRQRVEELQRSAEEDFKTDVDRKYKAAAERRKASIAGLERAFQAAFIAPLTGLIAPLVAAVDPISAAATLAVVASNIERIERETQAKMSKDIADADKAIAEQIAVLKQKEEKHRADAAQATEISSAMQALSANPTAANLNRLERLLEPASSAPAQPIYLQLKPGLISFYAPGQASPQVLPQVRKELLEHAKLARAEKKLLKFDAVLAKKQRDSSLARRLAGKKGTALEEEKLKLLAEAKERFAADEKARQAVEAVIEEEVRRRQPL